MLQARTKIIFLALASAVAAVAVVGTALATVAVYNNAFKNAASVKEVKGTGGQGTHCDKAFTDSKAMRITVNGGDTLCSYAPPVVGDRELPDHELIAVGRVLKKQTPKSVRDAAYLSLQVRFGGGQGYGLEITPKGRKFRLTRSPDNGGFPVTGRSSEINGLGKKNVLRLRAFGTKVAAFVNGKRLGVVTDGDPGQVSGRRVAIGLGSRKNANKGPVGTFDNVRVLVPNP